MGEFLNRRAFMRLVAGGVAAAMPAFAPRRARAGKDQRPNIVLILADDMGFSDLGCYGAEIQTPHLDRLAKGGVRFSIFYNNAKCTPTRASLLTGLYSQQALGGQAKGPNKSRCITIAEGLKAAGYRTFMAGKWHQPGLPVERGFERYFGLLDGACNYWNPGHARPGEHEPARKFANQEHRWGIDDKVYKPYTPPDKNFYTTDAFTDYALKFLDQRQAEDKPYFLYLAYNAPHYPMQAWPNDIAKYRGTYRKGWEEVRRLRYERQIEMGLIEKRWKMSPRDERAPRWDAVEDKDAWDLKMSVYAAMVDRMDQNIGRVLDKIRERGEDENTLVMFLSDNGGCAESYHVNPEVPPGPMEGFHTVDLPWANASNTPFRKFKTWDHEGGISTPFIAYWPKVIKPDQITWNPGHVIDLMPTCLEAAGAQYPSSYNGRQTLPLEGKSLIPVFERRNIPDRGPLFWQYGKSKAVRDGQWKLVANGAAPWELYDMASDRTEQNNLAKQFPERVKQMAALWSQWARRVNAHDPAKAASAPAAGHQKRRAGRKKN